MEVELGWKELKKWALPAVGSITAAYLLYKVFRMLRADCDLTLLSRRLKPAYFAGKVVWVTGASSGIGEALCYELSRHGARLVMTARSKQKMEVIRENLAHPENAKILEVDLSDPDAASSAPERALKLFDRIDILFNNAGVSQRCFFMDTDEKTHSDMMQINFNSPRTLIYGVLPGMLSQNFGHLINISSLCGKVGLPLRSTYCASKFALHGLTNALKYELYDKNVHFTLVCPGPVRTSVDRNSLMGGGKVYGSSDPLIQNGMTVDRCVELILIATSNQLFEAWIAPKPSLCLPYMAHYAQCLLHYFARRRAPGFIKASTGRPAF